MNAITPNPFYQQFSKILNQRQPKPTAILCISAHWVTRGIQVTAMLNPKTIHDFGGFPKELFAVSYPAPGSPELAAKVCNLLKEESCTPTSAWGLDHGAWSVLMPLFPKADIPVVQMSLNANFSANEHYQIAKKLRPLREEGVLILGSGNIIHNLMRADFSRINDIGFGYSWAQEAKQTLNEAIRKNDLEKLTHYDSIETLQLAIPTPEHYWPLLYALAQKSETDTIEFFNDEMVAGSISMTSLLVSEYSIPQS